MPTLLPAAAPPTPQASEAVTASSNGAAGHAEGARPRWHARQPRAPASPRTHPRAACPCAPAAFDFKEYLTQRSIMVNEALDSALPLRHPHVLLEAMR